MCGLLGMFHANQQPVDIHHLMWATNLIKHRGPDDEGYLLVRSSSNEVFSCAGSDTDHRLNLPHITEFTDRGYFDLALAYRRLSIIDLSVTGHQPMASQNGRYWIIYNGEIYNYLELRKEMEELGHTFHTSTDTEVLLVAYQIWGVQALSRLTGMFAFAILDLQARKLFLARDFFGIKPLYYFIDRDHFAFCSEIKPMMELPYVGHQVEPQALYHYLRYGVVDHQDKTLFASIKRLEPAHYMEIDLDGLKVSDYKRYWKVDLDQRNDISFDQASHQLRDMFMENIRIHLRSDVPLGATLSGGIDSSAVISCMRLLQGADYPLHTFSFIADDPAISEEKWVEITARRTNVIRHKVQISANELINDLEQIVYMLDEPVGSTSMYAENRVYRLVKEAGIKVTLGGQGADELLAGYRPYLSDRLNSLIRHGHWMKAVRFLANASRLPGWGPHMLGFITIDQQLPLVLRNLGRKVMGEQAIPRWMNGKWFRQRDSIPKTLFYHRLYNVDGKDVLRQQLYYTLFFSGLPALLRSGDRNSMMSSVESRVPFLTPDLVNFVFSLPEEYLINQDATTKAVFNHAMKGIVPEEILKRRDKIGFVPPEKRWLKEMSPVMDTILHSDLARSIPVFDHNRMRFEWDRMRNRGKGYDKRFWRWVNLILWAKCFSVEFD